MAAVLLTVLAVVVAQWRLSVAVRGLSVAEMSTSDGYDSNGTLDRDWLGHRCTASCGEKKFDGFEIGVGQRIVYKPREKECLAGCFAITQHGSCGRGMTKVAKITKNDEEHKLCCQVQECRWDSAIEKWNEPVPAKERLHALQVLDYDDSVLSHTCVCCNQQHVPWDHNVNAKCKFAFDLGGFTSVRGVMAVFSLGKKAFSSKCRSYCSNFPTYPHSKKVFKAVSWQLQAQKGNDVLQNTKSAKNRMQLLRACIDFTQSRLEQYKTWKVSLDKTSALVAKEALETTVQWLLENSDAKVDMIDKRFRELVKILPKVAVPLKLGRRDEQVLAAYLLDEVDEDGLDDNDADEFADASEAA